MVLDNLNVHRAPRVRELVEAAGCHLLFLPVSSPNLNPIELAIAKVKDRLRRTAARTFDAVSANARGFSAHCGCPLP